MDVLVALEHGGRTVGVVQDERGLWLTEDAIRGRPLSLIEGNMPVGIGLSYEETVVGGAAPLAATRAEVRGPDGTWGPANLGAAAWVAVLPGDLHAERVVVRFRDDTGEIVERLVPADAREEPAPELDASCPACDGHVWSRIRSGPDPRHRLRCRTCGHEEPTAGMGVVAIPTTASSRAVTPLSFDERWRAALASATFPVYAVDGLEPQPGGFGGSRGGVSQVTVRHEGASVRTESTELPIPLRAAAVQALEVALRRPSLDRPEGEDAAKLWVLARDRDASERASRAAQGAVTLEVDGQPADFHLVRDGEHWAAAGDVGEVRIVVTGAGGEPSTARLSRLRRV